MNQVDYDNSNYNIGTDIMNQTEEPAVRDIICNGLDALESIIRVGDIVEKQHDAGDDLYYKGDQSDKTQGVQKTGPLGCPIRPQVSVEQFSETNSNFYPVFNLV